MRHFYGKRLLGKAIALSEGTAINVGTKDGRATSRMLDAGLSVVGFSLSGSPISHPNYTHRQERFEEADVEPADMLWTSMTIEHLPNVGLFLTKCLDAVKEQGLFAIVAPSDKTDLLVDGHLTFWTPAHLMYNMVVAGWDCSEAKWYTDGREIAVLTRRKKRSYIELNYDGPDLYLLKEYFPVPLLPRATSPWLPDNFDW